MAKFLQPSLSGGELSPGMRGRVDLARYAISLGKSRNFITKPTGGGSKRPGTIFRGRVKFPNKVTRLVPFIYSTSVKYLIEMGDGYFRFWVNGSLLTNLQRPVQGVSNGLQALVTSAGHGFSNGDIVVITDVRGMTKVNNRTFTVVAATVNTFQLSGFNSTDLAEYAGGGTVGRIVEVVTPYDEAKVRNVRFTQSADVLFIVHGSVAPKQLRRTDVNAFELVDFAFKRGPFRLANSNDALIMAASSYEGQVTITCNADVFTVNMVGSLIYMEEQDLRDVKPWASAEKNVPVGAVRRSDSKMYRAVSIPASLGGKGAPYWVAGNVRPIHDSGRAFDGPQDIKDDGVNSYAVGVEWEFISNNFGIAIITGFNNARSVLATVVERFPSSITGTAPTPGNTWSLAGDGVTKQFSIPGNVSPSSSSYTVSINGVPTPSNPNNGGGYPPDEWCVSADSSMPDGRKARDYKPGDMLACYNNHPDMPGSVQLAVQANALASEECVRLVSESGASVVASVSTPMTLRDGSMVKITEMAGQQVLVLRSGGFAWEWVTDIEPVGVREVCKISVRDQCYFAGESAAAFIATHNVQYQKP